MKNSNFEDIFKKSSTADRSFPFEETSWTDLEMKLDKDKRKRRFLVLWILFGVGLLSTAISITIWKLDTPTVESMSYEQETFAKENVNTSTTINSTVAQEKDHSKIIEEVFPTKEVSMIDRVEQKVESISSGTLITINDSTEISERATLSVGTHFESDEQSRTIHSLKSIKILNGETKQKEVTPQKTSQIQEVHEDTTFRKEVVELLPLERTKMVESSTPKDKTQKSRSSFVSPIPSMSKNALTNNAALINNKRLDVNINQETKTSNRLWEVGLTLSYIPQEYRPIITTLTDTASANTQTNFSIEIVENDSMRTLYTDGFITGDEVFTRIQPIIRLSIGKQISNWILLRGGLIFLNDKGSTKSQQHLINNNPFDYALSTEFSTSSTLLDLGIHIQPNHKRLKPFLGLGAIFSIHDRTKFSPQVYNAQKEVVKIVANSSTSIWGFSPLALNIEGGVKYEITPKIEVGLEMFTVLVPGLNGRPLLTNPRLGMQFNYKF